MATEPTLRQFAAEIWRAFHEYAQAHGWPPDSFRLYLHYNEDWFTLHIILVTDNIQSENTRDQWKEIMGFLKQRLHEFLKYINTMNLAIRNHDQLNEGGIYEFGPEFVPIEDILAPRPVA